MYDEWAIDYQFRDVRVDAPLAAPCGCVAADQRSCCPEFPEDSGPTYIECLGCSAVWDGDEGSEWQEFGE